MVVDRFIFENDQITLSLCFTFIPKTGVGLPETGVSFYRANLGANLGSGWGLYTQKKVISKEEENALSKFLSQFPLNLRVFLSL